MGEALAAAIGIALSPFAIIPAIMLLFTVQPGKSAGSFAAGWFIGVGVATGLAVVLADIVTLPDVSPRWVSWLRIVIGVALVLLGLDKVVRRGGSDKQPAWLTSLSSSTPRKALITGITLSLANPKVALLAVAGGFSIGAATTSTTEEIVAALGFSLLATATALIPVIFYAVLRDKALAPLQRLNAGITKHANLAVSIVLIIIGVVLIVKGAQAL